MSPVVVPEPDCEEGKGISVEEEGDKTKKLTEVVLSRVQGKQGKVGFAAADEVLVHLRRKMREEELQQSSFRQRREEEGSKRTLPVDRERKEKVSLEVVLHQVHGEHPPLTGSISESVVPPCCRRKKGRRDWRISAVFQAGEKRERGGRDELGLPAAQEVFPARTKVATNSKETKRRDMLKEGWVFEERKQIKSDNAPFRSFPLPLSVVSPAFPSSPTQLEN